MSVSYFYSYVRLLPQNKIYFRKQQHTLSLFACMFNLFIYVNQCYALFWIVWVNEAKNVAANATVGKAKDNLGSLSDGKGSVANWESLQVNEDAYSTVERSKSINSCS